MPTTFAYKEGVDIGLYIELVPIVFLIVVIPTLGTLVEF